MFHSRSNCFNYKGSFNLPNQLGRIALNNNHAMKQIIQVDIQSHFNLTENDLDGKSLNESIIR